MSTAKSKTIRRKNRVNLEAELIREVIDGEEYDYFPLGKYVVAAPGVCGGRPTIIRSRIDARWIAGRVRAGESPARVAKGYEIPLAAVKEVLAMENELDYEVSYA